VHICCNYVADMYVKDIETKTTVSDVEPKIVRESAATAHVDGMNTLGPVVGNFCMKIAIAKAKEAGIGLVVAKGTVDLLISSSLQEDLSMKVYETKLLLYSVDCVHVEAVGLKFKVGRFLKYDFSQVFL